MTHRLIIGLGCALVAGLSAATGALAQTADPAVFRPQAPIAGEGGAPAIQLIQQDRSSDRDRMRRGERMNRDEDDDDEYGRPGWRPGMMRQGMGQGVAPGMMRERMMGHALGGTLIRLRRGDSAVNMRCPSDVRLNECVDAVGRLLDRLSTLGAGMGSGSAPPR